MESNSDNCNDQQIPVQLDSDKKNSSNNTTSNSFRCYQKEIEDLIDKRKNQILVIKETMQNDDVYFLKCFRITDSLTQQVEGKSSFNIFMKNLIIFSHYLSEYMEKHNSIDKLLGLLQLAEEYEYLQNSTLEYDAKKKVSELPILPFIHKDKNMNKKNKNRLMILEAKNTQVIEQMNFQSVVESFCMVLELIYITFADNIYNKKECFEIINKIDLILYNKFFDVILETFLNTSSQVLKEEFNKINAIIFEKDKYHEHSTLDQMIENFDNIL